MLDELPPDRPELPPELPELPLDEGAPGGDGMLEEDCCCGQPPIRNNVTERLRQPIVNLDIHRHSFSPSGFAGPAALRLCDAAAERALSATPHQANVRARSRAVGSIECVRAT